MISGFKPVPIDLAGHWLYTAVWLFVLSATQVAVADPMHEPWFAEPVTGSKVTAYQVELPLGGRDTTSVRVPDDCPAVLQRLAAGQPRNATVVQRRIWFKVEGDCRYHAFLSRFEDAALEDHVTGYDFRNANVADLPLDPRCAAGAAQGDCNPLETDRFGRLRYFPLGEPATDPEPTLCKRCALDNGLFRGPVYLTAEGRVRCERGMPRPSLRLLTVNYADVNGDRVLDAVLRFALLERGAPRGPMVLALTRFDPTGRFKLPEGEYSTGFSQ